MTSHLTLLEFNNAVSEAIAANFNDTYWLTAEVSEARVASNGHCYLELIEKDDAGTTVVARARANIWRTTYQVLAKRFAQATGSTIQSGMKLLIEVSATFHSAYGYSLTIHNIDPAYTLGDIATKRQEILQALEELGFADLNKQLTLPRPLRRIAIISSATAAGYGDFMRQLQQSGHPFECKLFPAIMQGEGVEASCQQALKSIAREAHLWDCVVIIRGGGAAADLFGFERYALAESVARFPLPVMTGIGHERDETVLDYVAHTRHKTPTAVAAFLVDNFETEIALLADLENRLRQACNYRLQTEHHLLNQIVAQLKFAAQKCISNESKHLAQLCAKLPLLAKQRIQRDHYELSLLEQTIALAHPQRILNMGYSIVRKQGKTIGSTADLALGEQLSITLKDGSIDTIVTRI